MSTPVMPALPAPTAPSPPPALAFAPPGALRSRVFAAPNVAIAAAIMALAWGFAGARPLAI
jgi:hypothetical protein